MIDGWVNLFAAKVSWLVHGHYSIALKFAKQALSYGTAAAAALLMLVNHILQSK
jgi:hypothetical protein